MDDKINTPQPSWPVDEIKTSGERGRIEAIRTMSEWEKANTPSDINGVDDEAGRPNDPDDIEASLREHPVIVNGSKSLACLIIAREICKLERFEYLGPAQLKQFLNEIVADARQCHDIRDVVRLEARGRATLCITEAIPEVMKAIQEQITSQHENVINGTRKLLMTCKSILASWSGIVPSEKVQATLRKIERLESDTLESQLNFFSLTDSDIVGHIMDSGEGK